MSTTLKSLKKQIVLILVAAGALAPQAAMAHGGGMGGGSHKMSPPPMHYAAANAYAAKKVTRKPSHNMTTPQSPALTKFAGQIGALGGAFQPTKVLSGTLTARCTVTRRTTREQREDGLNERRALHDLPLSRLRLDSGRGRRQPRLRALR